MKTKNKSLTLLIFIVSILLIQTISFTPNVLAVDNTTNIAAGDLIKNFRFTTMGSEPIVDRGAYNNKLRFEMQEAWTINRDTMTPVDWRSVQVADGGFETYLRYKVEARTRVNIFTNLIINQVSSTFYEREEEFLAGTYEHYGWLGGAPLIFWEEFITWEHFDFGESTISYNARNNVFSGALAMEFDIAPSPLPDVFGEEDSAVNDWAFIAVDSAGVVNNEMGEMSAGELPTIVTLNPSVYDSELRNTYTQTDEKTATDAFDVRFNPMTTLSVPYLAETFAEGIIPQSVGSSLSPTNLDGSFPWDPKDTNRSMTGCRIEYDLTSLSPKVRRMKAKLTWYEITLITFDELSWVLIIPIITVKERSFTDTFRTKYGDVALQVINRYVQPEIRVVFDIWTKVDIGPLTPYYEELKLAKPEEFYEELMWSSIAGGWGGSYQRTTAPDIFADVEPWVWVVIIIVIVIVVYIFYRFMRGKVNIVSKVLGRK